MSCLYYFSMNIEPGMPNRPEKLRLFHWLRALPSPLGLARPTPALKSSTAWTSPPRAKTPTTSATIASNDLNFCFVDKFHGRVPEKKALSISLSFNIEYAGRIRIALETPRIKVIESLYCSLAVCATRHPLFPDESTRCF